MRIVGVRRAQGDSGVEVATLAEQDDEITVIAPLADFWADPTRYLSRPPAGPTVPAASVERVPPSFRAHASSASG